MKREESDVNKDVTFQFNGDTVYSINPMGMRVLVKVIDNHDKSKGGLYIPDNAKDKLTESVLAKVVAVATASDEDDNEPANVSGIPQGEMVLIEKDIGIKVPWDDKIRIIETYDVLAVIEADELT